MAIVGEGVVAGLEDVLELFGGRSLGGRAPEREIAVDVFRLLRREESVDCGAQLRIVGSLTAAATVREPTSERRRARNGTERHRSSEKRTVIVISTGTGTPLSSVGVYRHCRTALTAASSSSGWEPSTRTLSTLAGRVEDGLQTRRCPRFARLPRDVGIERRDVHESCWGSRMTPPTRYGLGAMGGAGGVGSGLGVTEADRAAAAQSRRPGPFGMPPVDRVPVGGGSGVSAAMSVGRFDWSARILRRRECRRTWRGRQAETAEPSRCKARQRRGDQREGPRSLTHGLNTNTVTTTAWPAIDSGNTDQRRCRRAAASPVRSTSRKNS